MSTISTAYNSIDDSCCAKVILAVDAAKSGANVVRNTGVLNAVQSPNNKGTFQLILDPNKDRPTSGSFRKVYTKDLNPVCDQDTTADAACATPSFGAGDDPASGYVFAEHEIDLSIKREIAFDLADYKAFCVSPQEYLADRIRAMQAGVWQEINTKITDRLIAYVGRYYGQTAPDTSISVPKTVGFLSANSAGGYMFDPTGYSKMKDEFAKLGYAYDSPMIVGGSHLAVFQGNAAFYGGANVNGVTVAGIPNLHTDHGLDVAMADGYNWLASWIPGHVQLVGVNDISDDMIRVSVPNQRERMRIASPFGDGLTWDYYFDVADNGCDYKIKFQAWFDLVLPIPYSTCAKKPVLFFLADCENTCPDNGYPSGNGYLG